MLVFLSASLSLCLLMTLKCGCGDRKRGRRCVGKIRRSSELLAVGVAARNLAQTSGVLRHPDTLELGATPAAASDEWLRRPQLRFTLSTHMPAHLPTFLHRMPVFPPFFARPAPAKDYQQLGPDRGRWLHTTFAPETRSRPGQACQSLRGIVESREPLLRHRHFDAVWQDPATADSFSGTQKRS